MKFILCSVFLAHGAAVYAICATPALGLVGSIQAKTPAINLFPSDQINTPLAQKKQKAQASSKQGVGVIKRMAQKVSPCGQGYEQGWRVTGHIDLSVPVTCTVHIKINGKGTIFDWTVTPQLPLDVYKLLDRQMHQLKFRWIGTTPPPDQTVFEKKFVVY